MAPAQEDGEEDAAGVHREDWAIPGRAVVGRGAAAGTVPAVTTVDAASVTSVMSALLEQVIAGWAGKVAVESEGRTAGPAWKGTELAGLTAGTEDGVEWRGKVAGRVVMVVECGRETAGREGSAAEHDGGAAEGGETAAESGRPGGAVEKAAGCVWGAAGSESEGVAEVMAAGYGRVAGSGRLVGVSG